PQWSAGHLYVSDPDRYGHSLLYQRWYDNLHTFAPEISARHVPLRQRSELPGHGAVPAATHQNRPASVQRPECASMHVVYRNTQSTRLSICPPCRPPAIWYWDDRAQCPSFGPVAAPRSHESHQPT